MYLEIYHLTSHIDIPFYPHPPFPTLPYYVVTKVMGSMTNVCENMETQMYGSTLQIPSIISPWQPWLQIVSFVSTEVFLPRLIPSTMLGIWTVSRRFPMRDPCVILSGLIRMIGEFELLGWQFVTICSPLFILLYWFNMHLSYVYFICCLIPLG